MRGSLLVVVLAAGCWRNTGTETLPDETETADAVATPRRAKGATCGEVGENVRRIVGTAPDESLAKRADQIARVVIDRCAIDKWSMELRRCLTGAKTIDDSDGCERLATPEQQDALEREIEMMENAD